MIDIHLLRANENNEQQRLQSKEPTFQVDELIFLDEKKRLLIKHLEQLRKEKNQLAKQGAGGVTDSIRQQSIEVGKKIKASEKELEVASAEYKNLLLSSPNIPFPDVPVGTKQDNKPVKVVGEKQTFSFEPKNHLELNEQLGWFDFKAAAQMSRGGYVVYKKDAVRLLYVLTQMMIKNNAAFGFEPTIPPYLVNEQALVHSGNLPKFRGDYYQTDDELCLIPTAEVSLTNFHANSILSKDELPKRYTAWTTCFRREAGGYGAHERGLIRIHQFEKVELYTVCEPENSDEELNRMLECAQNILHELGLHYRVSLLATQDCSFSSAKTYDIEVWLPGQGSYYEVSSVSNCTDFQARRSAIRYREQEGTKPHLAHTLNGSSLALPRLMVALLEQYQQEDGTIEFPQSLQEKMDSLW